MLLLLSIIPLTIDLYSSIEYIKKLFLQIQLHYLRLNHCDTPKIVRFIDFDS